MLKLKDLLHAITCDQLKSDHRHISSLPTQVILHCDVFLHTESVNQFAVFTAALAQILKNDAIKKRLQAGHCRQA